MPLPFLQKVNDNQEITINIRVLPGSIKRESQEERVDLLSTRKYINKLLSPSQIKDHLKGFSIYQKIHRLRLWGITLPEETPYQEVERQMSRISFSDFNIKNVLQLKVLSKNLSNPNKSNTELLSNEDFHAQVLKHTIFQKTLEKGEILVLPSL